jgi:hypothetical protein
LGERTGIKNSQLIGYGRGTILLFAGIATAQYPTSMSNYIVAGSSGVSFQDQNCVVIPGIIISCSSDSRAYTEYHLPLQNVLFCFFINGH